MIWRRGRSVRGGADSWVIRCFGISFSFGVDSKRGHEISDNTELAVSATASVLSAQCTAMPR